MMRQRRKMLNFSSKQVSKYNFKRLSQSAEASEAEEEGAKWVGKPAGNSWSQNKGET